MHAQTVPKPPCIGEAAHKRAPTGGARRSEDSKPRLEQLWESRGARRGVQWLHAQHSGGVGPRRWRCTPADSHGQRSELPKTVASALGQEDGGAGHLQRTRRRETLDREMATRALDRETVARGPLPGRRRCGPSARATAVRGPLLGRRRSGAIGQRDGGAGGRLGAGRAG